VTIEPLLLGIMLVSLFVGGLINGLIGIGFALFVLNFLAVALGTKTGILVMSLLAPFPSALQMWRTRGLWSTWVRLRSLLAGSVVGSLVGTPLLILLPTWVISIGLGLLTVQFVIDQALRSGPPISAGVERRLAPVAGFFSGLSNGALGAAGPVVGSFLLSLGLKGPEFVFGISTVFTFLSVLRIVLLGIAEQYTPELILLSSALLIPAMGGQAVGFRLQGRANDKVFRRLLLSVLFVSSVNLLIRGGQGMLSFLGLA
jgi:uncharacterized membrane protein YfcA